MSMNIPKRIIEIAVEWRPVLGFEDLYEVSTQGKVRSKSTLRLRKLQVTYKGYEKLMLYKNGKHAGRYVHRVVAESFLCNPIGKKNVNHIDGNKLNNAHINLEWCTIAENNAHAKSMGR